MNRTTGEFVAEVPSDLSHVRLLVVSERPEGRRLLLELLKGAGRTIVTARSGADALRWLIQYDFAVVVLDSMSGGTLGVDLAESIRRREASNATPILFLTDAPVAEGDAESAYSLALVDYLTAPIIPVVLRAKVSMFVDLYRKTRSLEMSLKERAASEFRYRAMFANSPVPLWELDLSAAASLLAPPTRASEEDLRKRLRNNPAELRAFLAAIRLVQINRAAVLLCEGATEEQVVGSVRVLFGENAPELFADQVATLVGGAAVAVTEARLRTLKGALRHISVRISVLPTASGRWDRVVVSSDDIAELHRQRAELERSNRELQQFAYVASHDLRAPLGAIDAIARSIEERASPRLDESDRGEIALLRKRVRRMDVLLEDLLAYARADGALRTVESVSLSVVIAEAIELSSCPAGFIVECVPVSITVSTARGALCRVLLNLITNAVKHHDRGEGRIEVSVAEVGEMLYFAVKDDGPGIAPRFAERIFQMFQTLKPRGADSGSGMGLALVKKVVEGAGGSVWLQAREGRGAVFHFTWPKVWSLRPAEQRRARTGVDLAGP